MRDRGLYWLMGLSVVAVLAFSQFVLPALASDARARQAAADVGVENPRVVSSGPAWGVLGGCTQSDSVKLRVEGTRNGRPVSVNVCAALPFGGYTVRS
jgi:hypothetical protein